MEYILAGVLVGGIAGWLIGDLLRSIYKNTRPVPDFTAREIFELKNVVRERTGITPRPLPPEHG